MAVSITIRDVPTKARDELAARAALSGRSLQEYLRSQLIDLASRPDVDTVLARIRERKQRTGTRLTRARILAHHDADRR
jgi:antitoxin FitA